MSTALVRPLSPQSPSRVMVALTSVTREIRAVVIRILAYLCGVALLALIATDLISRMQDAFEVAPRPVLREAAWLDVERPKPAFAVRASDLSGKTESYSILRHPAGGGRKDILRWATPGGALPWATIEIYRPGDELTGFAPAPLEIAARTTLWNVRNVQAAGVIDSKFGPVALVGFAASAAGKPLACTGFVRSLEAPRLQISGWTCQGGTATGRQAVACLLNKLTLLAAGSDPAVAELFAHAELKRVSGCASVSPVADAAWLNTMDEPELRGAAN